MNWNFKQEMPYFVYDPEGEGMSYFSTIEGRDEYAKKCIQNYLDCDEWSEEVVNVVTGVITHSAQQTCTEDRPDDIDDEGYDLGGHYWEDDCLYKCNYELLPLLPLEPKK